ncbi:hypothetical protein HMPREF1051_0594, partial [Neisseria sicca VK64]
GISQSDDHFDFIRHNYFSIPQKMRSISIKGRLKMVSDDPS